MYDRRSGWSLDTLGAAELRGRIRPRLLGRGLSAGQILGVAGWQVRAQIQRRAIRPGRGSAMWRRGSPHPRPTALGLNMSIADRVQPRLEAGFWPGRAGGPALLDRYSPDGSRSAGARSSRAPSPSSEGTAVERLPSVLAVPIPPRRAGKHSGTCTNSGPLRGRAQGALPRRCELITYQFHRPCIELGYRYRATGPIADDRSRTPPEAPGARPPSLYYRRPHPGARASRHARLEKPAFLSPRSTS